jgi:hypothetical protein
MGRIALASGGGPSFNKLVPRGCKVGGQHLKGEDGGAAAAAAGWLAAAAVTAGSPYEYGWVSSHSRRCFAVGGLCSSVHGGLEIPTGDV